jgi:predicted negative regulator of RcsB-dependent stress response
VADHLTDDEQLQQLKNWWKDNGTSLIIAVLVGLIAYFGFQGWQNHQQQQAEQASALYSELLETLTVDAQQSLSEEKKTTANYLTEQLQNEYKSSQYAANASFLSAKTAVDDNKLDIAEKALLWVVENGNKPAKALAELRLARIYLAQKKYAAALVLVNTEVETTFLSLHAELKGDVFTAQGEWLSAREAYQQAIDSLGDSSSFRRSLLPIKLANLPAGEKK